MKTLIINNTQLATSEAFNTFWYFAAERQRIFMARVKGLNSPWSDDKILQNHKFTNAYRASDKTSQYLIRNVIYSGNLSPEDTIFRILLFKIFNKIETWELIQDIAGPTTIPNFSVDRYALILSKASSAGGKIYSSAYIMPSGPKNEYKGKPKHLFHLELLKWIVRSGIIHRILKSKTMEETYNILREVNSFGPFLAYQLATDINYSPYTFFDENEFVVPGPGALSGIRKCFIDTKGVPPEKIISCLTADQEFHFNNLGINFDSLWGRPLQLIDIQNLFCETDKYCRRKHPDIKGIGNRSKIKQEYHGQNGLPLPWYPPKWGLNEAISKERFSQ